MQRDDQKCNVFKIAKRIAKLIRILLVSKIFVDEEKKKELGKFIMKSFWIQSLHGTGIICPKQIQLSAYLAELTKTW